MKLGIQASMLKACSPKWAICNSPRAHLVGPVECSHQFAFLCCLSSKDSNPKFVISEEWKAQFIKTERKKLLNYKAQLVKDLQPRIYCPFAGYFVESHPSDKYDLHFGIFKCKLVYASLGASAMNAM